MAERFTSDITQLLADAQAGRDGAMDELFPLIYEELRQLAHRERQRRSAAETLNTTALVHEAYLKLAGKSVSAENRLHFLRIAARVIRDILVDYARAQQAAKRGGDQPILALSDVGDLPGLHVEQVLELDEALRRLERLDAEQVRLVELRYFVGLTLDEAADVLGLSSRTAKRRWVTARAWLYRELAA